MGELGALFWIGITVLGAGLVLVGARDQHRWGVLLSLLGAALLIIDQRHSLKDWVFSLIDGAAPTVGPSHAPWLIMLGVVTLAPLVGFAIRWALRPEPPPAPREASREKTEAAPSDDIELRRLLWVFSGELYRNECLPKGRDQPDYREAIKYADRSLAELERLRRETTLDDLRQALRVFRDDASALVRVFERNDGSDEAALTFMRCQRAVAGARATVDAVLFNDSATIRRSMAAALFSPDGLSTEELELLVAAGTAGPLSAYNPESNTLQVRSSNRTFGGELTPLDFGPLLGRPRARNQWLDAFDSLRSKGLIVGKGDAAERTITARGRAVLLCLVEDVAAQASAQGQQPDGL